MRCSNCGNDYERIGHHWSQSSCSPPEFTKHQHEIITGTVMGDGSVKRQDGRKPSVVLGVQQLNYIKSVREELKPLVCPIRQSGNMYFVSTRSTNQLERYAKWYRGGEKTWPADIKITPTVLKHLYAQDGNLGVSVKPYVRICTKNEIGNEKKVDKMLENAGLPSVSWDSNAFRWSVEDSREVFEYMGGPVDGYEYKWPDYAQ